MRVSVGGAFRAQGARGGGVFTAARYEGTGQRRNGLTGTAPSVTMQVGPAVSNDATAGRIWAPPEKMQPRPEGL